MHFEYLNIYVAQKLSCEVLAVISCYSLRDCQNLMLEALYDKICLPKCAGISLEINFEYLRISVAQKLTELLYFGSHLWKSYFFWKQDFLDNLFWPAYFFAKSFILTIYFWQLSAFDSWWQLLRKKIKCNFHLLPICELWCPMSMPNFSSAGCLGAQLESGTCARTEARTDRLDTKWI